MRTARHPVSILRSILLLKPSPEVYGTFRRHEADCYLLDMEDGVPPGMKVDVRGFIAGRLRAGTFQGCTLALRVNGLDSAAELEEDLNALIHPDVDLIILPMTRSAADVRAFEGRIREREVALRLPLGHFRLAPVLETPVALLDARPIAEASPRNLALIFGHNDFVTGIEGADTWESLLLARQSVVLAARAAGLLPIDTPYHTLDRPNGFILESERARALGFSGKILLHPSQVRLANQVFSPGLGERAWAEEILALHGQEICIHSGRWKGRTFFGPPHVLRATSILARAGQEPSPADDTVLGEMPDGGLNEDDLGGGGPVHSPFELTLRDALVTQWDSAFFNADRLSTSSVLARRLGFEEAIAPYCLPMVLCGSLSICRFSESVEFHLGIHDAVYLKPVHAGDTLGNHFRILDCRPTLRGDRSIVESLHELTNQRGEAVFRFIKFTLFPRLGLKVATARETCGGTDEVPGSEIRAAILRQPVRHLAQPHVPLVPLHAGQLVVHRLVKGFEASEVRGLSTLLRLTNVQHYDSTRFRHEDLIVAGPFAVVASLTLPLHDFGDLLYREVVHCSNINIVNFGDVLGALSFILDIRPIAGAGHLEELTIKTLGIKNLDMAALAPRPIPRELLDSRFMRPHEFEAICAARFPYLLHRIVCQTVWKALRVRPGVTVDEPGPAS